MSICWRTETQHFPGILVVNKLFVWKIITYYFGNGKFPKLRFHLFLKSPVFSSRVWIMIGPERALKCAIKSAYSRRYLINCNYILNERLVCFFFSFFSECWTLKFANVSQGCLKENCKNSFHHHLVTDYFLLLTKKPKPVFR